ncbi:MAG TPA: rod shape-determining protein RodA [Candidatus Angelobacter sp.]
MALDRRMLLHFDWTVFTVALALGGVGLVSVLSATWTGTHHSFDPLVVRQLIWIGVGVALMTATALFDYRALHSYAYAFYVFTIALLIVVAVAGQSTGGSRRWINLGLLKLEPSELAKLAVVLVIVHYLREEPPRGGWRAHQMLIPLVLVAFPAVLVLKQPDLGTALILITITATLVFVSGLNWRTMAVVALGAVMAAPVAWHYLKPYQRERLVSFINPQSDPLGAGYHIIQSEIAIGSGGGWGKGIFQGTQARLNFLPEQTTDFIFAVYAEEFGFAGSMLLLGLYAALIARGAWIARHARDRFGSLLAIGVSGIIFWQAAINIGMATGMLPVVGITLPLVSYGGSSLIAMMAAAGVLISINMRRYLF